MDLLTGEGNGKVSRLREAGGLDIKKNRDFFVWEMFENVLLKYLLPFSKEN